MVVSKAETTTEQAPEALLPELVPVTQLVQESAPEPVEHLDPAPDATPLPFSLAPSSSTGSEQRGKYLDRGKYLVAAAVREASSVLSICPHAKRAASVPLQCTTNELVPAGADELGAPEEESESESLSPTWVGSYSSVSFSEAALASAPL